MRIVITGATGLLGQNLLLEYIKNYLDNLSNIEIIILGKSSGDLSLNQRIHQIILNDNFGYLEISDSRKEELQQFVTTQIKCIESDLLKYKLGISPESIENLSSLNINYFYHVAALTDFRDSPQVVSLLEKINVEGTQQILELVSCLNVEEFVYVSSAYVCGSATGNILPDYLNINETFRNPYERTKLQGELLVRKFAKTSKIKFRYCRPSTICGRLIENPSGYTNKFDVFYQWIAFFLRQRFNKNNKSINYYSNSNIPLQVCMNTTSGLNIVPVDYVAKMMYQLCIQNDDGESYHLVNSQETPHLLYLLSPLKRFNFEGITVVEEIPKIKNKYETLYYKTIGKIFHGYINSEPILFDSSNLKNVMNHNQLYCPKINEDALQILINFAMKYNFGL
ncbi:SDR family oxidoreductase [Nostoc sp. C117]|uniref:SDR family oxidoreductase n=1 Tax=Nostoc sp. C117 TaxID=3349875 RepID=UPI00370D0B12